MVITPNYDTNGLAPRLLIYDTDDELRYTFETAQIAGAPKIEFNLRALHLHLGVNDNAGSLSLLIENNNNTIMIGQQWSVQLYLGKDSANLNRWFYGKVLEVQTIHGGTGVRQLRVNCAGWGIKTNYRYTNIKRFQDKTADGVTLDATDSTAKVSEIVKDIVQDTDHYMDQGLTTESEIIVTGVDDIDIKLADFQLSGQTWGSALSQLAAYGNAYWGIDGNRDLFLHQTCASDSGLLFTNDLDGLDA